ncbi:MAG: alpha/beta hydrolase [Ilumatobacteraceae bacterium]
MKYPRLASLVATCALTATLVTAATLSTDTAIPVEAVGVRYVDLVFTASNVTNDVVYASAPDLVTGVVTDLKIDIYQPTGDTLRARPVLLAIHGGGFRVGGKSQVAWWATEWSRRGYLVIAVNYRLDAGNRCQEVQDGKIPVDQLAAETARCTAAILAAQHDSQAVVRWARAHAAAYRIDSTRIAAIGSSAGAVTAVHLAQRSDDPGDVGDFDDYDSHVGAGLAMSGCNYEPASIGAGDSPVSMLHAEHDGAVPFQCAIDTATISRSKGIAAQTILYYGEATHAVALYAKYQSIVDASWTSFLIRHLDLRSLPRGTFSEIRGTPNSSAVVSLVATEAAAGYLQALSCGASPGSTSNVNIDADGQTRAGLAIVRFDATGTACIFNSMPTHVVVDLQGYLATRAFIDPSDIRLLDSRSGDAPAAGSKTVIRGRANTSAAVSIVATETTGPGWVQALSCATVPGTTSNLNIDAAGQTRAGLAIVRFDANGEACLYSTAPTHLVADLQGYFTSGAFDDVGDERILDSRDGSQAGARSSTKIHGRPDSSAFVSIVAVGTAGAGYVQVLPCNSAPGASSNLNSNQEGLTVAGAAVVRFDANGDACVFTTMSTHLVVDLQGYFSEDAFIDVVDTRLLDTRATAMAG